MQNPTLLYLALAQVQVAFDEYVADTPRKADLDMVTAAENGIIRVTLGCKLAGTCSSIGSPLCGPQTISSGRLR